MQGCRLMKRNSRECDGEKCSHQDHHEKKVQPLQQQGLERMERNEPRITLDEKNHKWGNPSADELQHMGQRSHRALVLRRDELVDHCSVGHGTSGGGKPTIPLTACQGKARVADGSSSYRILTLGLHGLIFERRG